MPYSDEQIIRAIMALHSKTPTVKSIDVISLLQGGYNPSYDNTVMGKRIRQLIEEHAELGLSYQGEFSYQGSTCAFYSE